MAKFDVIPKSGSGSAKYSGTPTFTGTYMKPGMLEFRDVASPTPIDFTAGDYVVYSRTGFTYRLYNVPQLKKQARSNTYGGAYIYQSVQFFDDSKQLEICPFRDLVAGDNRIHFSTQPSISTFEGVDGIARRIQACLDDMYPDQWHVRLATTAMGASQDLVDLMSEAREFTVSGVSLLGALDKVYEVWPEVGWVFTREQVTIGGSSVTRNVITIGGGGLTSTSSYLYGKGNGLTSITRTAANADELANRLFVYGSSKNMLPRWYNSQAIKDAQSVDIQNLMIPVSEWGLTNVEGTDLPDAAKAYVEDADSIARLGLRPKTYYFDGTGDLPEIYPTIREATIKAVRDALGSSSAQYYPSTTAYTDENARVDRVLSAQSTYDSGKAGEDGKASVVTEYGNISESGSGSVSPTVERSSKLIFTKSVEVTESGEMNFSANFDLSGSVDTATTSNVNGQIEFEVNGVGLDAPFPFTLLETPSESGHWVISGVSANAPRVPVSAGDTVTCTLSIYIHDHNRQVAAPYTYSIEGVGTINIALYRSKTFRISLRQIGFDIAAQALLGEGKTIAMRSGKCAGRTFSIKSVQYSQTTDSWSLECWRSEDESLSQWFPNTAYPVRGLENAGQSNEYPGDEFVLLDIAMPDIYVRMAENKLYQAAQDLLLDTATERWQYTPEIDAKFMVENNRAIVVGQNMTLVDPNIIGDGTGGDFQYFLTSGGGYLLTSNGERILLSAQGSIARVLVDTLVINEGESAIPTYKVTLRDRKRKTWTESESAPSTSSKPVSNATQEAVSQMSSMVGDSFFTLDENGNITLKEPYRNLWVPGWLSAGGVGTIGGGGGGGSTSYLDDLLDVTAPTPSNGDILRFNGSEWVNAPLSVTVNPAATNALGGIMVGSVLSTTPTIQSISSVSDRYYYIQCDSTGLAFVNVPWTGGSGGSTVAIDNLLSSGTRVATLTIDGTNYDILAPTGGTPGSGETDPVFSASAAYGITTSDITAWNAKIDASDLDDYALKTGANTYNFLVNTLKFSNGTMSGDTYQLMPRPKWVFTDSVSSLTPTTVTKYLAYKDEIPTSLKNPYALTFGSYTYDGSAAKTITASALGAVTIAGDETITGAKTFSANTSFSNNISVGGSVSVASKNMIDLSQSGLTMFGYGTRSERTFNAYGTAVNLRACDANGNQVNILSVQSSQIVVGSNIIPNYVTGLNLGGSSSNQRWANVYAEDGNLTGDLTMSSTSVIQLGPVTIEYDSVNHALHVHGTDNNNTIGLYCDGFIAAGGVQASS